MPGFIAVDLNITVSGFRTVGLYSQGKHAVIAGYKFESLFYHIQKILFFQNDMVGWGNQYFCFGIEQVDLMIGISNTGSCISAHGFQQYLFAD